MNWNVLRKLKYSILLHWFCDTFLWSCCLCGCFLNEYRLQIPCFQLQFVFFQTSVLIGSSVVFPLLIRHGSGVLLIWSFAGISTVQCCAKTVANQRTIQLDLSLLWRLNPRPPKREFTWLFHASFDVSRWITVFWWIATRVSQCSSFTAVIRAECTRQGRRWRGCKGTGTRRLRSGL